jgi:hypothetical protein
VTADALTTAANYIRTALTALVVRGDTTPETIYNRTPGLVMLLTGDYTLTAAPDAYQHLLKAIDTLTPARQTAARALLGLDETSPTPLADRRTTAAHAYQLRGDQFVRGGTEQDVLAALTLALLKHVKPNVTLPATPPGRPWRPGPHGTPPPPSAYQPDPRHAT